MAPGESRASPEQSPELAGPQAYGENNPQLCGASVQEEVIQSDAKQSSSASEPMEPPDTPPAENSSVCDLGQRAAEEHEDQMGGVAPQRLKVKPRKKQKNQDWIPKTYE